MCQAIDEPQITLQACLINANEVIANEYMFSLLWEFSETALHNNVIQLK